jgi:hypothetical protein
MRIDTSHANNEHQPVGSGWHLAMIVRADVMPVPRLRGFDGSPARSSWPPEAITARLWSGGSVRFGKTAMGTKLTQDSHALDGSFAPIPVIAL